MSDERFRALANDPRYRIPNRKESRTTIDPRFRRGLKEQNDDKARVDRYGRRIKSDAGKQSKKQSERLASPSDDEGDIAAKSKTRQHELEAASEDESEDDEEEKLRKLDPARNGGFSESSSEEESSDEGESELEEELADETAGQEQTEKIPMGEVTRRIACVNLDWDHIRASDIMAVASSFAPTGKRIERVTVYPSEFGRERMEQEETEGPPRAIFSSSRRGDQYDDLDDSSDDDDEKIKKRLLKEQANEGNEFDTGKLRQYQLERLRYYYAVIECDSASTGKALYDAMDGREYLTSANFFDLRFIPDEVTFDEQPRDECSKLVEGYKPNDFTTEALTHSKVRLTWDADDTTRKEVQKRAFSRAEMDENDLQAYIGSDSSDAESVASRKSSAGDRKAAKKEAERAKMRAALGLAATSAKSKASKDEPVGDMQITFTSGLAGGKGQGVFENEPQDEESTRQRYIRKEKERRAARKQRMRADKKQDGQASEDGEEENRQADTADPFDDPFFNDPKTAALQEKKLKEAERQKKRDARSARDAEAESRRAELELLMAEDDASGMRHFDMRDIAKAEKNAKKKGKKGKKGKKAEEDVVDDFQVDTSDSRFKALFDSHEFAVDPTNPQFKDNQDNRTILEEARKKRKRPDEEADDGDMRKRQDAAKRKSDDGDLKGLVARIKSKNDRKKQ